MFWPYFACVTAADEPLREKRGKIYNSSPSPLPAAQACPRPPRSAHVKPNVPRYRVHQGQRVSAPTRHTRPARPTTCLRAHTPSRHGRSVRARTIDRFHASAHTELHNQCRTRQPAMHAPIATPTSNTPTNHTPHTRKFAPRLSLGTCTAHDPHPAPPRSATLRESLR